MDAVEAAKSKEHSSPRPDFLGAFCRAGRSACGPKGKFPEKRRAHSPGAFLWYERLKFRFAALYERRSQPHPSMIATARVQPADARSIFTGKHDTEKPVDG